MYANNHVINVNHNEDNHALENEHNIQFQKKCTSHIGRKIVR